MVKTTEWYARRYAERYGFAIIPAEPMSKAPHGNDWGGRAMRDADSAAKFYAANPDWNIGFSLGMSSMCSLDIDCWESLKTILNEFGIPESELDSLPAIKGGPNGKRIILKIPAGVTLDYHKLSWPNKNDPDGSKHRQLMREAAEAKAAENYELEESIRDQAKELARYTVFELRSGDNRFDVLPPSIHPDTGKPYRWIVQPAKTLDDWPEPPGWLMAIWGAWSDFKPQLEAACPWAPKPERKALPARDYPAPDDGGSVIEQYLASRDLVSALERYGYTRKGKDRFLSPHSSTGLPGVILFDNGRSCYIHHASDPLCSDETGKPVNAFDLFCYYDHGNDASKAVKAAAQELGLKRERKETQAAKSLKSESSTLPPATDSESGPPPPSAPVGSGAPFIALGYSGNSYYYLPRGTEQVAEIRRGSHTSASDMLALAPIEWWEMAYPKEKSGIDWQLAASDLMRMCEKSGIYSSDRERGRGAWFDEGRAVLHLGDKLMVDGKITSIIDHRSKYIYTKQAPLEMGVSDTQADDALGQKFSEMFDQINWAKPIHSMYALGWCALAPICGGLKWRPHIWLTARRGAGKSWMQDNMVAPLLGPCALMVQGNTSEAGIRQSTKQDARPVIFDEAESEDAGAQRRMQAVIELARQSSSDSTAQIVKGTVDGHGMAFRMRSMFMLGSINVALSQAADESRFTVVTIAPHERTPEEIERFGRFSVEVGNLFTPENCAAIRARIYRMLPIIRENAATFAKAVAEELGDQRVGDQLGALLAGWHALIRRDAITLIEARHLISQLDFSDAEEVDQCSDEENCLNRILQSQVRFDTSEGQKMRSIGELVDCASGRGKIDGLYAVDANAILGRYGMRVEGNYLDVANKHAELQKLLRDSPWAAGWRTILGRIEGAGPRPEPVRFAGVVSRVTRIPIS